MKRNIIFLHIPKNGGMTFHSILQRQFRKKHIHSIKVIDRTRLSTQEFIDLSEIQRNKIRILKGHMFYGLHKYLKGESEYVTFLRDPSKRIMSYYRYVLSQPGHRLHKLLIENNYTLCDFVEKVSDWDIHNAQIRLISGIDDREDLMLEKALENIHKHFPVVGLLESYNESLLLIKNHFGLGIPFYSMKNKTPGKSVPSTSNNCINLIKEKNSGDYKLYSMMSDVFQNQLMKLGTDKIKKETRTLELANAIYNSSLIRRFKNLITH